jgi:hypothetical protein
MPPPSSGLNIKPSIAFCPHLRGDFLLGFLFNPEDEDDMFLRNVG